MGGEGIAVIGQAAQFTDVATRDGRLDQLVDRHLVPLVGALPEFGSGRLQSPRRDRSALLGGELGEHLGGGDVAGRRKSS